MDCSPAIHQEEEWLVTGSTFLCSSNFMILSMTLVASGCQNGMLFECFSRKNDFSLTNVFVFVPDPKRDVVYSGRILDGFTLASQVTEIKTVIYSLVTITVLDLSTFISL